MFTHLRGEFTRGAGNNPAPLSSVGMSASREREYSMKRFLRRLRGLLGVGLTWGALWSVIGAGVGIAIGIVAPEVWELTNPILKWTVGMGLYGLVSGVGFGGLLALREGRKTIFDVSLRQATILGIVGAAAVPLLFGALGAFEVGTTTAEVLGAILVTGVLGGTFAPAAIAIARRAELRAGEDRKLLSSELFSEEITSQHS